jgi:hypothetical protein
VHKRLGILQSAARFQVSGQTFTARHSTPIICHLPRHPTHPPHAAEGQYWTFDASGSLAGTCGLFVPPTAGPCSGCALNYRIELPSLQDFFGQSGDRAAYPLPAWPHGAQCEFTECIGIHCGMRPSGLESTKKRLSRKPGSQQSMGAGPSLSNGSIPSPGPVSDKESRFVSSYEGGLRWLVTL